MARREIFCKFSKSFPNNVSMMKNFHSSLVVAKLLILNYVHLFLSAGIGT